MKLRILVNCMWWPFKGHLHVRKQARQFGILIMRVGE